jgi:hypothetical protein
MFGKLISDIRQNICLMIVITSNEKYVLQISDKIFHQILISTFRNMRAISATDVHYEFR